MQDFRIHEKRNLLPIEIILVLVCKLDEVDRVSELKTDLTITEQNVSVSELDNMAVLIDGEKVKELEQTALVVVAYGFDQNLVLQNFCRAVDGVKLGG